MYYKSHDRRNFYSTFRHTAKRNQCYNLIQLKQNDSNSVEHNSKHWRKIIQHSPQILLSLKATLFALCVSFVVIVRFLFFVCLCCNRASVYIYIYIDKSHVSTNLLVYAGLNLNFLERSLRLNAPEHCTISEL